MQIHPGTSISNSKHNILFSRQLFSCCKPWVRLFDTSHIYLTITCRQYVGLMLFSFSQMPLELHSAHKPQVLRSALHSRSPGLEFHSDLGSTMVHIHHQTQSLNPDSFAWEQCNHYAPWLIRTTGSSLFRCRPQSRMPKGFERRHSHCPLTLVECLPPSQVFSAGMNSFPAWPTSWFVRSWWKPKSSQSKTKNKFIHLEDVWVRSTCNSRSK